MISAKKETNREDMIGGRRCPLSAGTRGRNTPAMQRAVIRTLWAEGAECRKAKRLSKFSNEELKGGWQDWSLGQRGRKRMPQVSWEGGLESGHSD